jgi:D-amino-acid oxidase
MTDASPDVFVLGAGVIGLTTAVCLAEAGLRVTVQAAEDPQATTSAVAGALWGCHMVGLDDRVPRWAAQTREVLAGLAAGGLAAVHDCPGLMAVREPADAPPEVALDYTRCEPGALPPGYVTGWRMTSQLVAMPPYLDYLAGRLRAAGGGLLPPRTFATLAEAAATVPAPVLVSCPGTGARTLVPDPAVTAVRGQIVVTANPGITEFFVGTGTGPGGKLCYLFPHGDVVVVGGTEEHGAWSRDPDPALARRIIATAAAAEPRLAGADVLGHRVGLRPGRPLVRLEAGRLPDGRPVVHNYGHGGAGVSLSWGCAREAAALTLAALDGPA